MIGIDIDISRLYNFYIQYVIDGVKSCSQISRTETWYFLWTCSIDEMIVDVQKSCFEGMVFRLSRLMRNC